MTAKLHSDSPAMDKKSDNSKNDRIKRKLDPKALALFTIGMTDTAESITADDFTVMSQEINCQLEEIKNGNIELIESFLYSQSIALHHMFQHFFRNYLLSFEVEEKQAYANLAFKAQNQSRKALLTLAEVKNPKKATFIKQQNNAINQQINNSENFSENFKQPSNELISEETYASLEYKGKIEAIGVNPKIQTMDKIDRRKDD